MNGAFEILIAGIIVLVVGLPLVNKFSKWKKEMDEQEDSDENSDNRC